MNVPRQSRGAERLARTQARIAAAINPSRARFTLFDPGDLHWCYGWNEDTSSCQLYLGTRRACASLTPCFRSLPITSHISA